MSVLNEGMHDGEFIGELAMGIGFHVDDDGVLISGQNLVAGAVVGTITASGKDTAYNNGAATGEEVASGLLFAAVDASGGDVTDVRVLRRGPAMVNGNDIDWGGNDQAGIDAGIADLLALGIKVV